MATALPLPAGLALEAASWEQTLLLMHQLIVQLLAVVQQQTARIAALEARLSQTSRTSDLPPLVRSAVCEMDRRLGYPG